MKVDKQIRNLLLKQSETRVVDSKHCIYLGSSYSYPKITGVEREMFRLELEKALEPKKYWINQLKAILGLTTK